MGIGIDELRRRYAAHGVKEEEARKRQAESILELATPREKNIFAWQQNTLFEFFEEIEEIFGHNFPLLIPTAVNVQECTRKPMMKWKDLTYRSMRGDKEEVEWMQKMTQAVCGKGGAVQIRLGIDSSNLCVLDVDHDDLVDPLLQANPILSTTLQTFGSKGRTFWFYVEGEYPRKKQRIFCGEQEEENPLKIELLTGNKLCTFWGIHYITGKEYQVVHTATPIRFNLDNLKLPAGCAWEVKYSSNGHGPGKKTFNGGYRARQTNGSVTEGKIDWEAYDAAREEDSTIVELLVEEYFEAEREEKSDGTYIWRCSNICGDPPHDGKKGSFEIDEVGRCTEWADESHYSLMQAITSTDREERYSYRDAFTFLAEHGYNFFMSIPAVVFPHLLNRPQTICYDQDFTCDGENYPAGVYRHSVGEGKGEGKDKKPDFPIDDKICSPIKAGGITHTKEEEEYSVLLDFVPKGKSEWRKILLSRASLMATRSDEARTKLASVGVEFFSNDWKYVHEYLERLNPPNYLTQVKLTGWVNKEYQTFVLPHVMLGKTTDTYFDPGLESVEYGISGTLEEWKEKVALLAIGNDWLLFGLSVALVGPLLEPLNLMGHGYHLHGDSSMGKTTVLRIGTSAWGSTEYLKSWKTTTSGLEITCAKRSGTLLVLDEADEATADTVYHSLYMIANGKGKGRSTKEITERPTFNWRVCALSSGERTLETQITESGRSKYKVGQEMRMVPLDPTKRKHGVFDDLHKHINGAEFSQHLTHETSKFYGNAGIQFIERLIATGTTNLLPRLKEEQTKLEEGLNPSPQEGRVARNLAAVVLAGELAIEFEIFPFKAGTIRKAVRGIFEGWLPPRIAGVHKNQEHNNIIIAIRDFIDKNGAARFTHPISPGMRSLIRPRPIFEQAGYQEEHEGKIGYLFTPIGMKTAVEKVCDVRRAAKALYDQKALYDTGGEGEIAKARRIDGKLMKLYHVNYEALQL